MLIIIIIFFKVNKISRIWESNLELMIEIAMMIAILCTEEGSTMPPDQYGKLSIPASKATG